MLKTNSKKAKENIKNYILENFEPYNEKEGENLKDFKSVAKYIYLTFYGEAVLKDKNYKGDLYNYFKWWCQGLPSILDTCYYYNRSAKDDIAKILEETEEEKNRYTEEEAEELLTKLIFNIISSAIFNI